MPYREYHPFRYTVSMQWLISKRSFFVVLCAVSLSAIGLSLWTPVIKDTGSTSNFAPVLRETRKTSRAKSASNLEPISLTSAIDLNEEDAFYESIPGIWTQYMPKRNNTKIYERPECKGKWGQALLHD